MASPRQEPVALPKVESPFPMFSAAKLAELIQRSGAGSQIKPDTVNQNNTRKRQFPEINIDINKMIKERMEEQHQVRPFACYF